MAGKRIGLIVSVGWLIYSTTATLTSKPSLTANGDITHFICENRSTYFWDCKDIIQEKSGAFDDLIPKIKSQSVTTGQFEGEPLAKKPPIIDPYDSNDAHTQQFWVNDAFLNQAWILNWGKFLSFLLLPILAFWTIPYLSIGLITWIKQGFNKR